MISVRDEVMRGLDRIEAKLTAMARWAWLNATLVRADPSLVLPAPAIGLMRVVSDTGGTLTDAGVFRSVGPIRGVADMMLAPIAAGMDVQPWRVRSTAWLYPSDEASRPAGGSAVWRHGVRVVLERPADSGEAAGCMTLCFRDAGDLSPAISRARATYDGRPLRWTRVVPPAFCGKMSGEGAPIQWRVSALFATLYRMQLPHDWAARHEVTFDLVFERPKRTPADLPCPRLVANAIPVWNSLPARYPSSWAVAQRVGEGEGRSVHVLDTRELGDRWSVWSIQRVGGATEPALRFSPAQGPLLEQTAGPGSGRYDLAFCPRAAASIAAPQLALVLSREARQRLDERGDRLAADFLATLGSGANGVPAGTEFQFLEPTAFGYDGGQTGTLVGPTWGGCDGVSPGDFAEGDEPVISSLLPAGHERSIDDVAAALEVAFGGCLELVDGRDLLHTHGVRGVAPLEVRVRFRRSGLPDDERRLVLASCHDFLSRYLVANPIASLRLVEWTHDATSHSA